MSYIGQENSVSDGSPIYLYEFVQQSTVWRFTSNHKEQTLLGETWEPEAISHSEISQSSEMSKDAVTLSFPKTNAFAKLFLSEFIDAITQVTIFRGHTNDGEFVTYWKGRVSVGSIKGQTVKVECESIFTSLRRPGLRARYQRTCRHSLYGQGCGLAMATHQLAGVVSSISPSGTTLVIAAASSQADGHWFGGILKFGNVLRMIIGHSGTSITVSRSVPGLADAIIAGTADIFLHPGCDRLRTTCSIKFNNIDNFGGFPWIPLKNPMGGSSIV